MRNLISSSVATTIAALMMFSLLAEPSMAQSRSRTRTTTGQRGGTSTTITTTTPNGSGTFSRSGTTTQTSPQGQTRSATFSGNGSVDRTGGQGVNTTYSGNLETDAGRQFQIQRDATYTHDQDTGLQRTGSSTITNDQGETVFNGQSTSVLNQEEGLSSTSTVQTGQGETYTIDTTAVSGDSEGQVNRSTLVTDTNGNTVGGSEAEILYEPLEGGGWNKSVTGTTWRGRFFQRTTTNTPTDPDDL